MAVQGDEEQILGHKPRDGRPVRGYFVAQAAPLCWAWKDVTGRGWGGQAARGGQKATGQQGWWWLGRGDQEGEASVLWLLWQGALQPGVSPT